ncbi:hypothetical protein ScPMuIL_011253 [Solemya velum]
MREKEFRLRHGSTFLNHGSYGVTPRRVRDQQTRLREQLDSHPDDWFRRKECVYWCESRSAIAEFVGAAADDLVFVENATTGVNTALKTYPWSEGDGILATSMTYGAVIQTCLCTIESTSKGIAFYSLDIRLPLESEDQVVDMYRQELEKHPDIKVAVIDHITSATAMLLPVKRLIDLCHEYGVIAIIDGAHAPGHVQLNLQELGADVYTGNLHKWLFCPNSCAILWVHPKHQTWLKPLVTSHFHGHSFDMPFSMQGSRDLTACYTAVEALNFYNAIGGMKMIVGYNMTILEEVVDRLVKTWDTSQLEIPKSMEAPCMRVIKLPDIPGYPNTEEGVYSLHTDMFKRYDIQTNVILVKKQLCIRLSANVYNSVDDYWKLEKAILEIAK